MFTFHDGEELEIFQSTGLNHNFHLTDKDFMIVGGATEITSKGRGAIIISDCFTRGHSSECDTFANQILCGQNEQADTQGGNFLVEAMEIWGFDVERPSADDWD